MKKSKIILAMLLGCLTLGFTACGENTVDSGQGTEDSGVSIEDVVKVEDGQVKVDEEKLEEVIEEETSKVWSTYINEAFKPAWEAHPVLKGDEVMGDTPEQMVENHGEPSKSEVGVMYYTVTNENGVSLDVKFLNRDYYKRNEDGTQVEMDENGVPIVYYKMWGFISTPVGGPDYWGDCHESIKEYVLGNKDYTIATEESYLEYKAIYDNFPHSFNEISDKTYEDFVEWFGSPGFLFEADDSSVYIVWVYDGGETPQYFVFKFDTNKMTIKDVF